MNPDTELSAAVIALSAAAAVMLAVGIFVGWVLFG